MFGATPAEPVEGMFSFVPCMPVAASLTGFPRPDLGAIEGLNPNNWRAVALNEGIAADRFAALWREVADTVLASGLALAIRLGIPPPDVFERYPEAIQ